MNFINLTLEEQDLIVKWLKSLEPGAIMVTEQQAEKIKIVWELLHWHDENHFYSFNQQCTILNKYSK